MFQVHDISILNSNENISVTELPTMLEQNHLLIDVRSQSEFRMCHIPDSHNVPIEDIQKDRVHNLLQEFIKESANCKGW